MSIETLKHLGLSDNEIKVYLANLELGQATVQALARKSGVKRTTIYMVIESLQAKGLVSQSKKAKKTVWLAEDPESLVALSEERAQALKKALPELKSIFNIPGAKPKVRFYEGKEGYLMVYESILKDCPKELLVIASYEDFLKHIDTQYENNWTKKRIEKKIFLRWLDFKTLTTEAMQKEGKAGLREVRFLPDDFKFQSTTFLYGAKIIMVSGKQKEFSAVVIESDEFCQTFKQLFEMLWLKNKKAP